MSAFLGQNVASKIIFLDAAYSLYISHIFAPFFDVVNYEDHSIGTLLQYASLIKNR